MPHPNFRELAYGLFTENIFEREAGIVQRVKNGIEEWVTAERSNPSVLPSTPTLFLTTIQTHAAIPPIQNAPPSNS